MLENYGVVANICINRRKGSFNNIIVDGLLYVECHSIERINAWMDSYRTILNSFETTVQNWKSWDYIVFIVILFKEMLEKKKSLNHFYIKLELIIRYLRKSLLL